MGFTANLSNYPPGCSGPPEDDTWCQVCALGDGDCICPECPECEVQGDPACYEQHGLQLTPEQAESKARADAADVDHDYSDWPY